MKLVEKLTNVANSEEATKYVTKILKLQDELKDLFFSNANVEKQNIQIELMKELAKEDKLRTAKYYEIATIPYSNPPVALLMSLKVLFPRLKVVYMIELIIHGGRLIHLQVPETALG